VASGGIPAHSGMTTSFCLAPWRYRAGVRLVAMCVIAVAIVACSTGEASERERVEDAIRALAEEGAPKRTPSMAPVETVVCEPLTVPTYTCTVTFGDGSFTNPFCAELREGAVYMRASKELCGPPSERQPFHRATANDFG
jgi:hypothetical protein